MSDSLSAAVVPRLLEVIEQDIVPLTRQGVEKGNKIFGAAILRKADLSLVLSATNRETENALWHGEISALNDYYQLPADQRPDPKTCYFLATHEPCSLCLSAITWSGFDNFFYLFGYEATRDAFNIPHDLKILQQVFKIEAGAYARANDFWTSYDLARLIAERDEGEREALQAQAAKIAAAYDEMSATYQASKGQADIPLR